MFAKQVLEVFIQLLSTSSLKFFFFFSPFFLVVFGSVRAVDFGRLCRLWQILVDPGR